MLMMAAAYGGMRYGERELLYLMSIPKGGLYLSARHNTVFQKLDHQQLGWMRVPRPEQAQLLRLFQTESGPPAAASTTTTLPKETKP